MIGLDTCWMKDYRKDKCNIPRKEGFYAWVSYREKNKASKQSRYVIITLPLISLYWYLPGLNSFFQIAKVEMNDMQNKTISCTFPRLKLVKDHWWQVTSDWWFIADGCLGPIPEGTVFSAGAGSRFACLTSCSSFRAYKPKKSRQSSVLPVLVSALSKQLKTMANLHSTFLPLGLFLHLGLQFASANFTNYSNNCMVFDEVFATQNPGVEIKTEVFQGNTIYTSE